MKRKKKSLIELGLENKKGGDEGMKNVKGLNWRELLKEWKETKEKEKEKKIVRKGKESLLIAMKEEILNVWEETNNEPFYARFVIQ